jgi:hypothetical protein
MKESTRIMLAAFSTAAILLVVLLGGSVLIAHYARPPWSYIASGCWGFLVASQFRCLIPFLMHHVFGIKE